MIYLDNNASTPVDPEVSDALYSSLKRDFGNPSSSHLTGRKAKEALENSRDSVADFLGCIREEVFFTSGGTESNNLALMGVALQHRKGHIITSAIEHPSILHTCGHLESLGFQVTYAPCDSEGIVLVDEIGKAIRKETVLITVMHANNETGVIQPVEEIASIAKGHGIPFHSDAAQTIGKMPFSLNSNGINMLTMVSHKFYGPKGVGVLCVRNGLSVKPILYGGGHEAGVRPGTENVAGAVGLAKACQIAKRDMKLRVSHTTHLRDILFSSLQESLPDIRLNGHRTKRLPNTASVCIPGISAHALLEAVKDQVALSAGSACHAGHVTPSHVLKAMGISDQAAASSVRLSIGKDNTEDEIKKAASVLVSAIGDLRKKE